MFKLIAATGMAVLLAGCVAAPGYGYYDPGYATYGPDYAPAYGYGTVNIWAGGGGGDRYRRGWGDHRGWGDRGGWHGDRGSHWQHGGGGGRGGGGHGGGGHGH